MAEKRRKKAPGRSNTKQRTPSNGDSKPVSGKPLELRGIVDERAVEPLLRGEFVTRKAALRPGTARSGETLATQAIADGDIVEIEFERGERLWVNGADYRQQFAASTARDTGGVISVPDSLPMLPEGMAARGPVKWVVKSLKIFGIDLQAKSARKVAEIVEKRKGLRRTGVGLATVPLRTGAFPAQIAPQNQIQHWGDERPYLVFLHGTLSSTWGSFGDLWEEKRAVEMNALRELYGDHALTYEHFTLPESPFENACDLMQRLSDTLPKNARVHLLSHSRGGLVGELLCRQSAFNDQEMSLFDSAVADVDMNPRTARLSAADRKDIKQGYATSRREMQRLGDLLNKKSFRVERFVRVACPALGTTLASGRLDRWLSAMGSLAGAAMPKTPWVQAFTEFGDFIAAVIKERTDPSTLAGLEAMMPDSPCVRLLNWPESRAEGELAVVSGDIDPDKWWANLLVWISDRFYDGDHDLVVNTRSMYGGSKRVDESCACRFKGPQVHHFNYFANQDSAQCVIKALQQDYSDFKSFQAVQAPETIARGPRPRPTGPLPVVFVLPGIMGSELTVGGNKIWADILDLALGRLHKLEVDDPDVQATGLIQRYYGDLCEFLSGSHKVIQFPYDWRLSLEQEADRLQQRVREEFEQARQQNQPVRILAHSMGGLLARTLIARHPGLWREMCNHAGTRLVMLGTPNGGSHSITEMLVGQSATMRKLALLDFKHRHHELLEIISQFPGVLALLPVDSREDYFAAETWDTYREAVGPDAGWHAPRPEDLERARAFRALLDDTPLDPERTRYVAGCADVTVEGMRLNPDAGDADHMIELSATVRGDGRVTWDTGIPPGVPCWYMDVEHGDLVDYPPAFDALKEILVTGTTNRLPVKPPVVRAVRAASFPLPRAAEELYPDEEDLLASAMGAGSRKRRKTPKHEPPVKVNALCGNLAYSTHPVAVGHYVGDRIMSAEHYLDLGLNGALRRRHQLGVYPGDIETSAIFVNPSLPDNLYARPQGAIVVGLGQVGQLTAARLARSFTHALLDYVENWKECGQAENSGNANKFGVTSLLIGTGAGGVDINDSVFALLQGVQRANTVLRNAQRDERISDLEIIELWEDRGIRLAKELVRLQDNDPFHGHFVFDNRLHEAKGARQRAYYSEPSGWWQRLQILGQPRPDQPEDNTLRFSALTRRARSEVRLLSTQRTLVDQFIEQSITTTQDDRQSARTLFELLLPNEFKEQAPEQDDMVLIVDEAAARYPWELLQDPKKMDEPPFAAQHGLVRQLESLEFRERVREVTNKTALVIGDPISKYVELKGAQEEAKAVWRMLQERGFSAEQRIRPAAVDVLDALFKQPYRVLHLAGHGVYEFYAQELSQCKSCGHSLAADEIERRREDCKPLTGMILGDDVVLSPAEVRQIREVPELVFINCCHLGLIEATNNADRSDMDAPERNDYHRIAANVATQFIRMGVRAVIAAGWAVDDSAATTFATSFYDAMLDGETFGEAVKRARCDTYEYHPSVNTWGAYQCYGDPDFRLVRDTGQARKATQWSFVTPTEAVVAIENVKAALATKAEEIGKASCEKLDELAKEMRKYNWLDLGCIRAAFGRAYGEAKIFDQAVMHYQAALDAEDGAMTLADYEQLYNCQVRHAAHQCECGSIQKPAALKIIDVAVKELRKLPDTEERLSLLASACKRKFDLIEDKAQGIDTLNAMRDYYAKAYEQANKKGRQGGYPLINWLTGELVCRWTAKRGAGGLSQKALREKLQDARTPLQVQLETEPSFWNTVMLVDRDLLERLNDDDLDEANQLRIANKYKDARKLASPREFNSVTYQLGYLSNLAPAKQRKQIQAIIEQL